MKPLLTNILLFSHLHIILTEDKLTKEIELGFRVVGGYHCKRSQYAYLALISSTKRELICGGSFLNSLWVLTAAHCCEEFKRLNDWDVTAGLQYFTNQKSNVQQAKIKKFFIHDNYTWDPLLVADICLLKLASRINTTNTVKYVKLIDTEKFDYLIERGKCKNVTLMGFGTQQHEPNRRSFNPHVQCVHLEVIDQERCLVIDRSLTDAVICATDDSGKIPNKDVCFGDSGGPMFCEDYQIALVSGGFGCGDGIPGFYTRVDIYLDFIRSVQIGSYHPKTIGFYVENDYVEDVVESFESSSLSAVPKIKKNLISPRSSSQKKSVFVITIFLIIGFHFHFSVIC